MCSPVRFYYICFFCLFIFDPFKVIARHPIANEDSKFSLSNCTAVPGGQGQSWSLLTPAPLLPLHIFRNIASQILENATVWTWRDGLIGEAVAVQAGESEPDPEPM